MKITTRSHSGEWGLDPQSHSLSLRNNSFSCRCEMQRFHPVPFLSLYIFSLHLIPVIAVPAYAAPLPPYPPQLNSGPNFNNYLGYLWFQGFTVGAFSDFNNFGYANGHSLPLKEHPATSYLHEPQSNIHGPLIGKEKSVALECQRAGCWIKQIQRACRILLNLISGSPAMDHTYIHTHRAILGLN